MKNFTRLKVVYTSSEQIVYQLFFVALTALTLIIVPMSVFAQEDTSTQDKNIPTAQQEENTSSTTEAIDVVEDTTVAQQKNTIYDNYKREELPLARESFNDFVVGPGRFELQIAPGETKTVMLNVSNRLGQRRLFQFTTEDMTSNTENNDATIQLLGDKVGPYTIKDYISVPYRRFYLENNQRAIIPVTISIPEDAEPGGFYGSILTEVMPDETAEKKSDVAPAAALVSRIGTLFYVTTPGDINYEGSLIDFTTLPKKSFFSQGPITMGLVYENTGSVHLTPFGEVTITNMLGEVVGQVELKPWFVMPQSVRTKEISWDREFLMGRYTVTAVIERGYDNKVDTRSLVFWVIPWKILIVVFSFIFVFFLLIRFLFKNFEFKKKT